MSVGLPDRFQISSTPIEFTASQHKQLQSRLLEAPGHTITLTGHCNVQSYEGNEWDTKDVWTECSCGYQSRRFEWLEIVPKRLVWATNQHLTQFRAAERETFLALTVEMKRGHVQEWWVVHKTDVEFFEAAGWWNDQIGSHPHTTDLPWSMWVKKGSKFVFKGQCESLGGALSNVYAVQAKREFSGYKTTMHVADDVGVVPPTASVNMSVRLLVDEAKDLKKLQDITGWLERAEQGILELEVLQTVRDQIHTRLTEMMDF